VTPADLVAELLARGVVLRQDGEALKVKPVSKVTPEELDTLREHKAEVLRLLSAPVATPAAPPARRALRLDPVTVREVLGHDPDPHDLAGLKLDVMQAVARLAREIAAGTLGTRPLLVRDRPLADWLNLDDVARLLRAGKPRR
jgi:hypothetical protein